MCYCKEKLKSENLVQSTEKRLFSAQCKKQFLWLPFLGTSEKDGCRRLLLSFLSFKRSHPGQNHLLPRVVRDVPQAHVESLLSHSESSVLGHSCLQAVVCGAGASLLVWESSEVSLTPWCRVLLCSNYRSSQVLSWEWDSWRLIFFLGRGKHETSLLWSGRTESPRV